MKLKHLVSGIVLLVAFEFPQVVSAQCGGIMEPGFAFLTSSRGCAPFTVSIETLYLASVPGTNYYVTWGDGTPEEMYTQVNATGVVISHSYPNSPIDCGYDVTIDASNACNPRGSVVEVQTQVVVWTNDVVAVGPAVYRVCQGFAADVLFTDNSDWNCFPRLTRENNAPRWIQWLYGTGAAGIRIPGVQVNGINPGSYPYNNPAPGTNPIYPVVAPGQVSLPINVPVTTPADIGKEFEITLKNWNQCNAYDNNLLDSNPFNPVSGDLVNGDNAPQVQTARIVIVDSPQPTFVTRLGGSGGPLKTSFCVGDDIYFENQTPPIGGASFQYSWEFYDNDTGTGSPLATSATKNPTFAYSSSGTKLIRLSVRDANAAGNCVAVFESTVDIVSSLLAQIGITDLTGAPITPWFCQAASPPLAAFDVRFTDISTGTIAPSTEWRWEFDDENGVVVRQEPAGGGFSSSQLGPFDETYVAPGIYHVRLIVHDNLTSCQSSAEAEVRVYQDPQAAFTANTVCDGTDTHFEDASTLSSVNGESIILREWDFAYDGVTFNKDPAFDNQVSFDRPMGGAGVHQVALRVTTDQNSCNSVIALPVVVNALPNATISPDILAGCSKLDVNFTNASFTGQPAPIDRYEWEVDDRSGGGFSVWVTQHPGDPNYSSEVSLEFENTTTSNALFDVRLHAVTTSGCEQTSGVSTITVFPGTASGFISSNYSPFNDNCSPLSVDFVVDAATQGLSPTDYTWRVSDSEGVISEVSTGTTPGYTFEFINNTQTIREFQVTLISTLASGCFGDSTRLIRISPVPISEFQVDTLAFNCDNLKLEFVAQQKGLPEYHWTILENGIVVYEINSDQDVLPYDFPRPTTTPIDVEVTLETGNITQCTSSPTSHTLTVPLKPVLNASFTADPSQQTLPNRTVNIINQSATGPWSYAWDLGDGTTLTALDVGPHVYPTYGTYTITLVVSTEGCVEQHTETIEILPIPPMVDFDFDPGYGCAPLTVTFTNLSQYAEPDTYSWNFGEGQGMSHAVSPVYTYFQPGKYTVSLSASNVTGQTVTETKQQIIEVFPRPTAQFDVKPKVVIIPGGSVFTDNQSYAATSFDWDFGDGSTSIEFEPQHRYQKEGTYTIQLVANNSYGCADTVRLEDGVRAQRGGQVLVPNAFSPGSGGGAGGGMPGDGKNDTFLPLTRGVTQFQMLIFNRWGELLFETTDAQVGWDGMYQGRMCQQDVYVYKINGVYENGERFVRVGDVNLIR